MEGWKDGPHSISPIAQKIEWGDEKRTEEDRTGRGKGDCGEWGTDSYRQRLGEEKEKEKKMAKSKRMA